jgi:hypothetical protein
LTMAGLPSTITLTVALAIHALAVPLVFTAVATHYVNVRGARDPFMLRLHTRGSWRSSISSSSPASFSGVWLCSAHPWLVAALDLDLRRDVGDRGAPFDVAADRRSAVARCVTNGHSRGQPLETVRDRLDCSRRRRWEHSSAGVKRVGARSAFGIRVRVQRWRRRPRRTCERDDDNIRGLRFSAATVLVRLCGGNPPSVRRRSGADAWTTKRSEHRSRPPR